VLDVERDVDLRTHGTARSRDARDDTGPNPRDERVLPEDDVLRVELLSRGDRERIRDVILEIAERRGHEPTPTATSWRFAASAPAPTNDPISCAAAVVVVTLGASAT